LRTGERRARQQAAGSNAAKPHNRRRDAPPSRPTLADAGALHRKIPNSPAAQRPDVSRKSWKNLFFLVRLRLPASLITGVS
jgi:hypothetical protein